MRVHHACMRNGARVRILLGMSLLLGLGLGVGASVDGGWRDP